MSASTGRDGDELCKQTRPPCQGQTGTGEAGKGHLAHSIRPLFQRFLGEAQIRDVVVHLQAHMQLQQGQTASTKRTGTHLPTIRVNCLIDIHSGAERCYDEWNLMTNASLDIVFQPIV
jgi:hypothetical protein